MLEIQASTRRDDEGEGGTMVMGRERRAGRSGQAGKASETSRQEVAGRASRGKDKKQNNAR